MTDEPEPRTTTFEDVAEDVAIADLRTGGFEEFNAVFLIAAREPTLVETGPGADAELVATALRRIGLEPGELAHVVVTHIHIDHAGGAGALLERYPGATLWVHERGAPHLADPERLVASTARTYGEGRMRALYGETRPVPAGRIRAVGEGAVIPLGDRSLEVLHTPGHASHHLAFLETGSGSMFVGEAIGSHLPWADCYRPALPPPEVDVDDALASIERIRQRAPERLLVTHFGAVDDVEEAAARGAARIRAWAATVRNRLERNLGATDDELIGLLTEQAREEYEADSGTPFDQERYDAIGSIGMNAKGLARYWRKRWEREGGPDGADRD